MLLTRHQALLEEYPEYSPEWGCSDCDKLKKDLSDFEDGYSIVRDHLEKILNLHDSMQLDIYDKNFNTYIEIYGQVLRLCAETGVNYNRPKLMVK